MSTEESIPQTESAEYGEYKKTQIMGTDMTMDNGMLPAVGVFCSSIVLLLATINAKSDMTASMKGYANTVAAISMILSLTLLAKTKQTEMVLVPIKYFLFVWSFTGGCILTFGTGPFSKTGNGYFCIWLMCISSFLALGISYDTVRNKVAENASPLKGLGLCSLLAVLATFPYLGLEDYYWESMFTFVISILTVIVVLQFLYKHQKDSTLPGLAYQTLLLLAILWCFTAGVATTRGPFLVTGNGYFASWGGAIFSAIAAKEAHQNDNITPDETGIETPPSPKLFSPDVQVPVNPESTVV